MHTNFPFSRVFVLGIILFLLGLAAMIISVIAFVIQSWGHYAGTGMWGGSIILASGLTAVFVSHLKSDASVKTFCVFSVIATLTSLAMLVLSAGGLTLSSGFYSRISAADYNKRTSNLIHASLLVISVFCLSGSTLATIVCCKYLIFECRDNAKHNRHTRNMSISRGMINSNLRGGATNNVNTRSTSSRTPLCTTDSAFRRHSDNLGINRVQIEYRRSHKRSASDQPHSSSQARRQRYSQLDPISDCPSLPSPFDIHCCPNRRGENNRRSSQEREVGKNNKERERMNIIPLRKISTQSLLQVQIQENPSRTLVSTSPKVLQPTESNEEDPPAYEAVESSMNALTRSHSDSGDESDMENSSNAEVYGCGATVSRERREEGEIQNGQRQENCFIAESSRQHKRANFTTSCNLSDATPSLNLPGNSFSSERQTHDLFSSGGERAFGRNELYCNAESETVVMRKATDKSSAHLQLYVNTRISWKESQCLSSVSPEVCAITGESPEPVHALDKEQHLSHQDQENYYENGPHYKNIRCEGRNGRIPQMNHLSKPSSLDLTDMSTSASIARPVEESVSSLVKKVPVQVISSPGMNVSPQSPQNSFDCTHSAFRPVGTVSSQLSPTNIFPQISQNTLFNPNNGDLTSETQDIPLHTYVNTSLLQKSSISSVPTDKYIEQGAIPKAMKLRGKDSQNTGSTNKSWKNLPLPFSYNHSQSASDESEKKLPPKTIPFADSDPDVLSAILEKESPLQNGLSYPNLTLSAIVSSANNFSTPSSVPLLFSPVSTKQPSLLSNSPFKSTPDFIHPTQTKFSTRHSSEAVAGHSKQTVSQAGVPRGIKTSSFKEASTQVNSSSIFRWHSHRMGSSQPQPQKKHDELQKSQVIHRTVGGSSRTARPSSMPVSSGICHGVSGLANDRQFRNRFSESLSLNAVCADSVNPLSRSSSLTSHLRQQTQPPSLRQNILMQHYPLQPQQPRLGVQLHQRRQQQHQLQQNIESQQQHQQMQQQQLLHQPQQQGIQSSPLEQQGRNGRPLFSVLL